MSQSAYLLTRLAFADVVHYQQIVEEVRRESSYRAMTYRAARAAVVEYHSSAEDLGVLHAAAARARMAEQTAATPKEAVEPRNNAEVIEAYSLHFARPFRPFFSLAGGALSIEINGMTVTGSPHLAVRSRRGRTKYIYLLTSARWSAEQKEFFVALLGEIVAANVEGVAPRDVEGLDCRRGETIVRNGLGQRHRRRAELICDVLRRLELA